MSDKRTIEALDAGLCAGCEACSNVCPKDAIQMTANAEGFFEPVIDRERCIVCGRCEQVCPVLHVPGDNEEKPQVFAVKTDPETMKRSTSAGVFAVLAEYTLSKGGVVCGAAFDESFEVRHQIVDTEEEMQKLRGSKYVQSRIGTVFREVRSLLEQGRLVLFSGTPCQVAGLHNFLGKSYENLYTMDVVCHGVPAPGSWKKYLEEDIDVGRLESVNFRHKGGHGFKKHHIAFTYKDGEEVVLPSGKCPYYRHFTRDLGLRSSCNHCEFALFPRQGDFSAGDFWGAEKLHPEWINGEEGLSIFFLNNARAQALWPELCDRFTMREELSPEEAMAKNRRTAAGSVHANRNEFFELLSRTTFDEAVRGTLDKKYDVVLYGTTMGGNFGGVITYYALYRAVQKMGYSVIMLRPPLPPKSMQKHSKRFCEEYQVLSEVRPLNQYAKFNRLADTFLLGSDQIWNYELFPGRKDSLYLDFVEDSKKKIAYAASFGFTKPTIFPDHAEKYPRISQLMKHLDCISVRESDGVEICREYYRVPATHVLDPVFLLTAKDYNELAVKAPRKPEGPYMAVYCLTPKPDINRVFQHVSSQLGLLRVNMATGNTKKFARKKKNFDMPYCENLQLEEWLYNIQNSEFVVTDSYHCVCFSIIFRRKFILIQSEWAVSRIKSLLTKLNLLDRWFVTPEDAINSPDILTKEIDYDAVYEILNREIYASEGWLRHALNTKKQVAVAETLCPDCCMQQAYRGLYQARTAKAYFRKYQKYQQELILVMAKKGRALQYMQEMSFFPGSEIGAVTKGKMNQGFAYICDSEAGVIRKKLEEFSQVEYSCGELRFLSISESQDSVNRNKTAEIYVEKNGIRTVYPCEKDGLYILLYSKPMEKVIDYVRVDVEQDRRLRVERV